VELAVTKRMALVTEWLPRTIQKEGTVGEVTVS
jgi:hypothetical protein